MNRKPYTPTRTCPHHWCKPLHLAPAPFGLAVVAFNLWHSLSYLVVLASGILMVWWIPRLVHYRPRPRTTTPTVREVIDDIRTAPTAVDLEMEDAKYEGTGWRMLEVRKGWARAAVAMDVIVLTGAGVACTAIFVNPAKAAEETAVVTLDAEFLITTTITGALFWFLFYAHKKATQPRKPKRAWVPASLRTNA